MPEATFCLCDAILTVTVVVLQPSGLSVMQFSKQ